MEQQHIRLEGHSRDIRLAGRALTVPGQEIDEPEEAVEDAVVRQVRVTGARRLCRLVAQIDANICSQQRDPSMIRVGARQTPQLASAARIAVSQLSAHKQLRAAHWG